MIKLYVFGGNLRKYLLYVIDKYYYNEIQQKWGKGFLNDSIPRIKTDRLTYDPKVVKGIKFLEELGSDEVKVNRILHKEASKYHFYLFEVQNSRDLDIAPSKPVAKQKRRPIHRPSTREKQNLSTTLDFIKSKNPKLHELLMRLVEEIERFSYDIWGTNTPDIRFSKNSSGKEIIYCLVRFSSKSISIYLRWDEYIHVDSDLRIEPKCIGVNKRAKHYVMKLISPEDLSEVVRVIQETYNQFIP